MRYPGPTCFLTLTPCPSKARYTPEARKKSRRTQKNETKSAQENSCVSCVNSAQTSWNEFTTCSKVQKIYLECTHQMHKLATQENSDARKFYFFDILQSLFFPYTPNACKHRIMLRAVVILSISNNFISINTCISAKITLYYNL